MKHFVGTLLCGVTVFVPIVWGLNTLTVLIAAIAFCGAIPCFQKAEQ